jgi:ADP-heptose:LPS heptosyltransferase
LTKILVIRFSSIGDIVLTSPIVRCLKKQLQGAEVHYLTKRAFLPVLENNPNIDKLYSIEKDVAEVIEELKKEKYDFVVDLHHNLRTMQVKRGLGIKSASFPKLNIEKWLMVNLKVNRLPDIHIVDRYFTAVAPLNVKSDNAGLDYFIPAKDEVNIGNLPESHRKGYIAFVIGAKHYTKQLPAHKIISICKKINAPVVILGGPEDAAKAKEIEGAVGANIYNAVGKNNINQSASLIKQARKVITHDTGLMHIASAFKKDIISVWGNTIPGFGMYPYLPGPGSHIMEVKNLSCRPCSKLGYKACPKKHFNCMEKQDEEQIAKNVRPL